MEPRKSHRISEISAEKCRWKGGAHGTTSDEKSVGSPDRTQKRKKQVKNINKKENTRYPSDAPKFSHNQDYDKTDKLLPLSQPLEKVASQNEPVQFLNDTALMDQLLSSIDEEIPIFVVENQAILPNLPSFTSVNSQPTISHNNVPPDLFKTYIDKIYEEMVCWRKNLFFLPNGNAGKSFINTLSYWINNYNKSNTFHGISLKVVMILPNLLLQKPSSKSKAKDHSKALEERLNMWKEGKLLELLRDCKVIQKKLRSGKTRTLKDINRIFTKLVFEGKTGAALKFLDENADNAVLSPSESVINKLKLLHPPAAEILPHSLINGPLVIPSPSNFSCIFKAASQTKGSGGPSLLDAKQWRHILCSTKYGKDGKNLREELARFARKIATEITDPITLESYVASRLIPLNKTPGEPDPSVRPIGVGEVMRRIVGKTISWALSDDIQEAGGSLQVSTGLKGGAEAAIHAMKNIFELENTDGVILVDAENAFNKLNRQVALHNMQYICPSFATVLINTYRIPARLFIAGGGEIMSAEGTTQGDTLAMQFYGLSTNPLIQTLNYSITNVFQVWLADDATGAGQFHDLKEWWDKVSVEGRRYGYHVKPSKSWLIIKDESRLEEVETIFRNTTIQITTSGKRHLGAALGTEEFKTEYMSDKVDMWCKTLNSLVNIAKIQPHAAYAAYLHAEQHKYTYFLRTVPGISELMEPLDNIIMNDFIPALFGENISPNERELFSLPIKDGGLGLRIWKNTADSSYDTSKSITKPLQQHIIQQNMDLPSISDVLEAKHEAVGKFKEVEKQNNTSIVDTQTPKMKRNIEQLSEPGASSWLSARPLKEHGFDLNKSEFQDALNLRYDKPLKNLPSKCPCTKDYTITHAMDCHKGGFVNKRHDSIRNFEAGLLKKVTNDVQIEPMLQPCNGFQFKKSANIRPDARSDVRARGFWREGQNAFFDIMVTNADCASQHEKPVQTILKSHENDKKRKYNARIMEVDHGTFTPIILTIKGVMGHECRVFHKTLSQKIAEKTGEKYSEVTRMIRVKLSFLVLKAALLCVRGSRAVYNNDLLFSCEEFGHSLNELGLGVN